MLKKSLIAESALTTPNTAVFAAIERIHNKALSDQEASQRANALMQQQAYPAAITTPKTAVFAAIERLHNKAQTAMIEQDAKEARQRANALMQQQDYPAAIKVLYEQISYLKNITDFVGFVNESMLNETTQAMLAIAECHFLNQQFAEAYNIYCDLSIKINQTNELACVIADKKNLFEKNLNTKAQDLIAAVKQNLKNAYSIETANQSLELAGSWLHLINCMPNDVLDDVQLQVDMHAKKIQSLEEARINYEKIHTLMQKQLIRPEAYINAMLESYDRYEQVANEGWFDNNQAASKKHLKALIDDYLQDKFIKLIAEVRAGSAQNNLPLVFEKLMLAAKLFNTITPENLKPTLQSYNKKNLQSSLATASGLLRDFEERRTEQSVILSQEIIERALKIIDQQRGSDCLYSKHIKLLTKTLCDNLRTHWYKFDSRSYEQLSNFTDPLVQQIAANIKPIGWLRWLEDYTKNYSLVSCNTTQYKSFPIRQIIATTVANYLASQIEVPASLAIFRSQGPHIFSHRAQEGLANKPSPSRSQLPPRVSFG